MTLPWAQCLERWMAWTGRGMAVWVDRRMDGQYLCGVYSAGWWREVDGWKGNGAGRDRMVPGTQ